MLMAGDRRVDAAPGHAMMSLGHRRYGWVCGMEPISMGLGAIAAAII